MRIIIVLLMLIQLPLSAQLNTLPELANAYDEGLYMPVNMKAPRANKMAFMKMPGMTIFRVQGTSDLTVGETHFRTKSNAVLVVYLLREVSKGKLKTYIKVLHDKEVLIPKHECSVSHIHEDDITYWKLKTKNHLNDIANPQTVIIELDDYDNTVTMNYQKDFYLFISNDYPNSQIFQHFIKLKKHE